MEELEAQLQSPSAQNTRLLEGVDMSLEDAERKIEEVLNEILSCFKLHSNCMYTSLHFYYWKFRMVCFHCCILLLICYNMVS